MTENRKTYHFKFIIHTNYFHEPFYYFVFYARRGEGGNLNLTQFSKRGTFNDLTLTVSDKGGKGSKLVNFMLM